MPPRKPGPRSQHLVDPRLGRPTKLTPELQEAIVREIRAGNFLAVAAERHGVRRQTVFRWIQEAEEGHPDPSRAEFRDAVVQARAEAETDMVSLVRRAVMGGVIVKEVTRTLRDGTVESETVYTPPDGRVGLEFLSRAFPDRWQRSSKTVADIQVSGPDGGPIQVEDARFGALAARLHANANPKVIEGEVDERPQIGR